MTEQNEKRDAAIKRVEAKRAFRFHLALYGAVNLLLIAIWAITGAGYFWPIWPIIGLGNWNRVPLLGRVSPEADHRRRDPTGDGSRRLMVRGLMRPPS